MAFGCDRRPEMALKYGGFDVSAAGTVPLALAADQTRRPRHRAPKVTSRIPITTTAKHAKAAIRSHRSFRALDMVTSLGSEATLDEQMDFGQLTTSNVIALACAVSRTA